VLKKRLGNAVLPAKKDPTQYVKKSNKNEKDFAN
jgi:hypothetical protein